MSVKDFSIIGTEKKIPLESNEGHSIIDKLPSQCVLEENLPANHISETPKDEKTELIPSRKKYFERYYLAYGNDYEPDCINSVATRDFLDALGFGKNNPLTLARESREISIAIASSYDPTNRNLKYCDFCGSEIFGVEYEMLADGRERCIQCSKTVVRSESEFKRIFEDVRRNMESFFDIRLNVGVKVEMVNSRTLHKRLGYRFTPTPKHDGRILGVAIRHKDGSFNLLVENGSPRMATIMTMVHELTHIWQYVNWNAKLIRKKYGKKLELEVYEGMAKWAEVQYAYLLNEPALAKRTEIMTAYRDDEYGRGFLRYRANYPFTQGTYITKNTPFMFIDEPLSEEYCGAITVQVPQDDSVGLPPDDFDDNDQPSVPKKTPTNKPGTDGRKKDAALIGPIERTDDVKFYARELLSDDDKQVYDLFLEALKSFATEIDDMPKALTPDEVSFMFEQVLIDHPEIIWFRANETCYFKESNNEVVRIELHHRYSKEDAKKALEEISNAIQPFYDSIDDEMSDFEVVLRAYETIVNLVDYDTIALDKQKMIPLERRRDIPDPLRTIYGVFVDRKAVCAGYARAMQFLLQTMGIESAFVSSGIHAWNLVKLEGDYYHLDVTWADGSDTNSQKDCGKEIDYSFYCVTTEEITRLDAHQPLSILKLPNCTATKCNYHHRFGLYFEDYNETQIRELVCELVEKGTNAFSFKFGNAEVCETAYKELFVNNKMSEILKYAAMQTNVKTSLKYVCSMKKELFVISFYTNKN